MNSTLFIHVPKTGGTSIDTLFAEQRDGAQVLRNVQLASGHEPWGRLEDPDLSYVSGHVPAGALSMDRFAQRITVLRPPLDLLASMLSYTQTYFPEHGNLDRLKAAGTRHAVYQEYFSPGFDRLRMITDMRYGVTQPSASYADPCAVAQAIDTLRRFDHVLDFRKLDGEIQRLVIEQGLFPHTAAPNLRAYDYEPNLAEAGSLLSPFDVAFFEQARSRFRPLPPNLDALYDEYRQRYCHERGLRVAVHETVALALHGPVGSGWFGPSRSELGDWFRWASTLRATLEIPLVEPGTYLLTAYVHPHEVQKIGARLRTGSAGRRRPMDVVERTGVTLLQARVKLARSDWLHIEFEGQAKKSEPTAAGADLQQLLFVLGRVLLRHVPD